MVSAGQNPDLIKGLEQAPAVAPGPLQLFKEVQGRLAVVLSRPS
jgi:hypothetical protein